jgi:uncharacterized membrane protein (DUF106 family)
MSPKTLIRQRGILVDQENKPLKPQIKELDKKIQDAENADDKKTMEELVEQKRELLDNSRYLIDLHRKILIFLEPPHHEL